MTKTHKSVYWLITSNILTLITLLIISFHYNLPSKILNRFGLSVLDYGAPIQQYTINYNYKVRRSLFEVYQPKKVKIVMLGNSLTYGADWNELLSRTDVANRGIGSDITEGFLNRLSDIYKLEPEICLIMGGINDIERGIPVNDIFANITKITDGLRSKNITPVIQSTLLVSSNRHNWKETNKKVNELNRLLEHYTKTNDVDFIDVNKQLSRDGALNPIYTYDGLHLFGNAYAKWRDLILLKL
jgi:lysophospholipase L1-like esterase